MQDAANAVTVVLTLRDRAAYTEYFLTWALDHRLQYLVLDGSGGSESEVLFRDAQLPNVSYRRYPPDVDFRDYMTKVDDGLQYVKTPLLVMMDNDDFVVRQGIEDAAAFLLGHPSFNLAGGDLVGHYHSGPGSRRSSWPIRLADLRDLEHPSPEVRVARNRTSYRPIWNLVSRTESFRRAWEKVSATGIVEPHLVEFAMADLMLGGGEFRWQRVPHYVRLENQSHRAIEDLPRNDDMTIGSESWWRQVDRLEVLVASALSTDPWKLPGHEHRHDLLVDGATTLGGPLSPVRILRDVASRTRLVPRSTLDRSVRSRLALPLPVYR